MEALNRAWFEWLAAGFAPSEPVLALARIVALYGVFAVPIALLASWLLQPASRRSALAAAVCGGAAAAASELVAALMAHPRPFMLGLSPMYLAHSAEGSFPSAHASLMLAIAASLLMTRATRAWGAALALLGLLTGWARVYVGLHFPLDVAGSAVVGVTAAVLLRADQPWIGWLQSRVERSVDAAVAWRTRLPFLARVGRRPR